MECPKDEKTKTELSRIHSPSSVSSIHSVRPLEWDSGADIGYQCELQSGLSTVERIALVSGTVNLLGTCKTQNMLHSSYRRQKFSRPVAHSSPFITNFEVRNKNNTNVNGKNNTDKQNIQPLVNYSISDDYSFDDKKENFDESFPNKLSNIKTNYNIPQNFQTDKVTGVFLNEGSKSLEDIRCINRLRRTSRSASCKSRSSHNIFANLNRKNSDEKNSQSSSSIATVVSCLEENLNSVPSLERKYSNKGIQVGEVCLDLQLHHKERCHYSQFSNDESEKSNLHHNDVKTECSNNQNYPTYIIDDCYRFFQFLDNYSDKSDHLDGKSERNETKSESCQSNVESLEGGSFEYVPGSVYDEDKNKPNSRLELSKESDSEVNTMCTEVVDGVDLITRYVDNLCVSNKRKIIRKMAKFLINNIDGENSECKEKSAQCQLTENILSNLCFTRNPEVKTMTSSDKRPNSSKSSSRTWENESRDNSNSSVYASNFITSAATTDNNNNNSGEPNERIVRNSANSYSSQSSSRPAKTTASSYTCNSSSSPSISHKKKSNKDLNIKSGYSLKQYLEKERDAQLLWIKSGIDHLNNLKKLYESQRSLRSDLISLKRYSNTELISSAVSERDLEKKKTIHEQKKNKSNLKTCKKSRIKCSSLDLSEKSSLENVSENSTNQFDTNLIKSSCKNIKKKELQNKNDCNCNCKCNCKFCGLTNDLTDLSENKENISEFSKISNRWQRYKEAKKSGHERKTPISYTVIFDSKPTIFTRQNFVIKEQTVRKSVSKIYSRRNRIQKTNSMTELRCTENEVKPKSKQLCTLQEYLFKNKPGYIQRAEIRRQCLSEIARLREIRDKSRNELLAVINASDRSAAQCGVPPPPLSVLRIFNDKSIKRQTERKYQQLPEVQNRKLELKRKENYRRNQIMAKVFTKKLQKKVLRGQLNLSNTANVMST